MGHLSKLMDLRRYRLKFLAADRQTASAGQTAGALAAGRQSGRQMTTGGGETDSRQTAGSRVIEQMGCRQTAGRNQRARAGEEQPWVLAAVARTLLEDGAHTTCTTQQTDRHRHNTQTQHLINYDCFKKK
jgi:hypothetical protein